MEAYITSTSLDECLGTVVREDRTTSSPFWREGRPRQVKDGLDRRVWRDFRMEGWEEGVRPRRD